VSLLQHTGPALTDEQGEQLHALSIPVVDGTVVQVESGATGLTGVRLADGHHVQLDALVVAPRFAARAELFAPLGLAPVEMLMDAHVLGTRIEADATGATAVPGVWVAGNVTDLPAQVVTSAAAGLAAGAAINGDLIAADTKTAVDAHRYERVYGEQAWGERYRSQPQNWSGNPNPVLVTEVVNLPPGTALDAGSGEGADAVWLATRGWHVTGAELSTTALKRAAAQAEQLGLPVTWQHLDLTRQPASGTYAMAWPRWGGLLMRSPMRLVTAGPSWSPKPAHGRRPIPKAGRSRSTTRCCAPAETQPKADLSDQYARPSRSQSAGTPRRFPDRSTRLLVVNAVR